MTKIREILHARHDEIVSEVQAHQTAIKSLQAELKEVEAALNAIEKPDTPQRRAPSSKAEMSISGMVRSLLRDRPSGLPTREIRVLIKKNYGREVTPKNMSWHMSNLRRNKEVIQEGENWVLTPQKSETPSDGESEGASSSTDEGKASSDESREIDDLIG